MAVTTLSHIVSSFPASTSQSSHYGSCMKLETPPSPPMESAEPRCSLPSISNLLAVSDAGSPTTETSPSRASSYADRPQSSHYNGTHIRSTMPPTPPMSTDASFDHPGAHSPSSRSVSQLSTVSAPSTSSSNYYYQSTPPLEDSHITSRHNSVGGSIATIPRAPLPAPFAQSGYITQPLDPYYTPMHPEPAAAMGMYYQRPLPQAFPPMVAGPNPWQHHHYVPPTAATHYPQSQDRYVCQTCNKAFSRPSSLRIHSHSHTGEKPFKCPHHGCGKAFSVRSNMKRHERGCHTAPYDGHAHAGMR